MSFVNTKYKNYFLNPSANTFFEENDKTFENLNQIKKKYLL